MEGAPRAHVGSSGLGRHDRRVDRPREATGGSFDAYIWGFTGGEVLHVDFHAETSSELSDRISKDLKRRGMKFVGTTVVYSYLQAIGVVNTHSPASDLHEGN
ncbi:MAG: DNA-3-methyladenine glycosylase I [Eggerthellaceae bacterium]|nr:DNA-3-methyladenine glycosylase I [Eggerthellaceae bacterium]